MYSKWVNSISYVYLKNAVSEITPDFLRPFMND